MTEQELLQLIRQADAENWKELNLRGQHLQSLPDAIGSLQQIQVLHLGWTKRPFRQNFITTLPDAMGQLANLQSLDLNHNELTVLPDAMGRLTNLQSLDLSVNKLTVLPDAMGRLTNLQSLDLRANRLKALPDVVGRLTNLQTLDLSGNGLTALPDSIGMLSNLQSLDLSGNKLTALPDSIGGLTNLQSLDLGGNKLTALPDSIGRLTNLQSLDLSGEWSTLPPEWKEELGNLKGLDFRGNGLIVLPESIGKLTNLKALNLRGNGLIVLPESVGKLANLRFLDLRGNKLKALPDWMANISNLPRLETLYIGQNPLDEPPAESLGKALTEPHTKADIDAIRRYFLQLQETPPIRLYEAKLLIIGEGGAGKTTLARKLKDPSYDLPPNGIESTEGIEIGIWNFPISAASANTSSDESYTVKVWDFGGQEIYFATHQFFLTKQSVYLLVADTRRQHIDFYTWLLMQETYGEDSPVLLIKNRNRQHGNSFHIDNMAHLRERFQNLKEVIDVDLNEVPGQGWQELLHAVRKYLLALPHIGLLRPSTWLAVRSVIRDDPRSIIKWSDFVAICQSNGMKRAEDIQQFGEYMHNLGDILYFHEDQILRDFVILKPTWGLDAVYRVLDNEKIERNLGIFTHGDLSLLWNRPDYRGYHIQLLRLMVNFQLCYPLPDHGDMYIVPQLLDDEPPRYQWDDRENLQLRYAYPIFMPRGILSRGIVKLHKYIEEKQRLVWRSGVILHDQYARAEVLELRGEQQIRIRVHGSNKRDLLMLIVRALDELHSSVPKLQVKRLVPCNCPACVQVKEPHFFGLEALRDRLANRRDTIECQKPPYHIVSIDGLLSDMRETGHDENESGGLVLNIERIYLGRHDDYSNSINNVSVAEVVASQTVYPNANDSHARLTDSEREELEKLAQRKALIERPLRVKALLYKYAYVFLYLAAIPFTYLFLEWLIKKFGGWEEFEPLSWIVSSIIGFAGPLLVWLSPENFKPSAIENMLLARWSTGDFEKYDFDLKRYRFLADRNQKNA